MSDRGLDTTTNELTKPLAKYLVIAFSVLLLLGFASLLSLLITSGVNAQPANRVNSSVDALPPPINLDRVLDTTTFCYVLHQQEGQKEECTYIRGYPSSCAKVVVRTRRTYSDYQFLKSSHERKSYVFEDGAPIRFYE